MICPKCNRCLGNGELKEEGHNSKDGNWERRENKCKCGIRISKRYNTRTSRLIQDSTVITEPTPWGGKKRERIFR